MDIRFAGPYRIAELHWIEDGSHRREARSPGADVSDLPADVQAAIAAECTPEVVAAYEAATTPPPSDPPPVIIRYEAFESRWTEEELSALHAAVQTSPVAFRMYTRAVVQGHVNLSGEMANQAKALFVSLGVLTEERAGEIFTQFNHMVQKKEE